MEASAPATVPPRLKERYEAEIKPSLQKRFGYKTVMEVPRIEKITLNMGVGDAKQDSNVLDAASEQLATIAGQAPNVRRAKKSIANFKLRDGMPVGVSVTLRQARMWEFLDRLTAIAIPRIRDFRGLNARSFDGRGNYSMGVREQIIFPEIDYDAIDQTRGLDVTITTSAQTDEEAYVLLRELGMPFSPEGAPGSEDQVEEDEAEEERRHEEARLKAEAESRAPPSPHPPRPQPRSAHTSPCRILTPAPREDAIVGRAASARGRRGCRRSRARRLWCRVARPPQPPERAPSPERSACASDGWRSSPRRTGSAARPRARRLVRAAAWPARSAPRSTRAAGRGSRRPCARPCGRPGVHSGTRADRPGRRARSARARAGRRVGVGRARGHAPAGRPR